MSWVTNVFLSIDTLDADEAAKVREINAHFEAQGISGFVSLDDPSLPQHWYGGTKNLEANIYLGVFNHLDRSALVAHIRSHDWPRPTSVQLIYKDQEDSKFTTLDVVEHGWDDRTP